MRPRNAYERAVAVLLVLLSLLTLSYTLVTSTNLLLGVLAIVGYVLVYWFTLSYGNSLRSRSRKRAGNASKDDPIEILRRRYARGEIDEREFERALERLQASAPDEESTASSRPSTEREIARRND